MAAVGQYSLYLALVAVVFSTIILFWGAAAASDSLIRVGRRVLFAFCGLVGLSSLSLWYLLLTDDFSVRYVVATSRIAQPTLYKIVAFWSSQEGSLLFWLLMLAVLMAASAVWARRRAPDLMPYALAVQAVVGIFFTALTAFMSSPFEQYPGGMAMPDGQGMTPLLRDVGMLGHPVFLFLGYVGLTVPYSFAMATLLLRKEGNEWLRVTRPWTLAAWLFLTIGIMLGGWWSYRELGWGGYWAWDPVENVSLIPWLAATAYFHSVMVEERRGLLKTWNVLLVVFAFILTIFGTFIVRSGILDSVHAFAESDVGPWFIVFIGLLLAGSLYLIFDRYDVIADRGVMESYFSKEGSFLLNNLILVSIALTVLMGTTYPLVTKLWGVDVTIGAPYYNRVAGTLLVLLLVLMAVCPLIAWRRAAWPRFRRLFLRPAGAALLVVLVIAVSGVRSPGALAGYAAGFFVVFTVLDEFLQAARARARITGDNAAVGFLDMTARNPRRYGGYLVHLGIAVMAVGIVGSQFFQKVNEASAVPVGGTFQVGGHTLQYRGLREKTIENEVVVVFADIDVYKGARKVGVVRPERRLYPGWEEKFGWSTEAGIMGGLGGDVYAVLAGWDTDESASFQVWWNPLVAWVWIGCFLIIGGALFALTPRRLVVKAGTEREGARRVFSALSELEYDFQMGKVSKEDYLAMREELDRDAVRFLTEEDRPGRSSGGRDVSG